MTNESKQNCLTVVFHLPDDPALRAKITNELCIDNQFHGAVVTSMSMEDEISKIEYLEGKCSADDMAEASRYAADLHEKFVAPA